MPVQIVEPPKVKTVKITATVPMELYYQLTVALRNAGIVRNVFIRDAIISHLARLPKKGGTAS
jgi:hypothetical protein